MKKIISVALICALMISILSGCAASNSSLILLTTTPASIASKRLTAVKGGQGALPSFRGLNDPELLDYLEDSIYGELVADLNSDEYFVENVSAVYISKEYLEEMAYNSKTNIFFGYSLEELDAQFQGTRYVFTLGDNGETVVEPFSPYDDTYDRVIRNVAIGTGVILVCVTVSVVTAGAGAPAISLIFAASAKTGAAMALSGAALGGASSAIITGLQTHDVEQTLKAAALGGSEGFKWGAVSGAIGGGAHEAIALKGATLNGLSMTDAATIQKETKLPLSFIKNFHSKEEFEIYKAANLSVEKIGGSFAYSRIVDMNSVITDSYGKTMTNAERILAGNSPVDPSTGIPYELHHIGQEPTSPLAILTKAEHMQGGHNKVLHFRIESDVEHGYEWTKQVSEFWNAYLESYGGVI